MVREPIICTSVRFLGILLEAEAGNVKIQSLHFSDGTIDSPKGIWPNADLKSKKDMIAEMRAVEDTRGSNCNQSVIVSPLSGQLLSTVQPAD